MASAPINDDRLRLPVGDALPPVHSGEEMTNLSIALVMFDGAEEQDVVGPWEMFWWATS